MNPLHRSVTVCLFALMAQVTPHRTTQNISQSMGTDTAQNRAGHITWFSTLMGHFFGISDTLEPLVRRAHATLDCKIQVTLCDQFEI